jgi:hypothetical protein
MYEVVGEAILPNHFSKTAQLHLESHSSSYFLKNSFTSEVELCQTTPKRILSKLICGPVWDGFFRGGGA